MTRSTSKGRSAEKTITSPTSFKVNHTCLPSTGKQDVRFGDDDGGSDRLGDTQPMNLSPLYKGQVLVHGLGFSPDRRTLVVVSIASNSVTFIDTATNRVKHTTYVGRSPHEAFFTQDGREVWVTVRGEDYVAVLDGETFAEKRRITVPNGPGMTIFSLDGRYGYLCSSFTLKPS